MEYEKCCVKTNYTQHSPVQTLVDISGCYAKPPTHHHCLADILVTPQKLKGDNI
jgi:hypothetical protein